MAAELLTKQLTLGDLISKVIRNTDKMGVNSLTAKVLQQRIILTNQYWNTCLQNHHALCAHREELKDSKYFQDDLFSQFELDFIPTKAELSTRFAAKIGAFKPRLRSPLKALWCQCTLTPQRHYYPS